MKDKTIRLGFEVGTGEPVDIPLRHMVVTGQTQEAGKTTALEALISRGGRGLAFVTKRGESSFANARVIRPYFREQADWQFVAAILEASRQEKMRFERAWIIRASKGARSLADVLANVRRLGAQARGMSADVYLTLEAYLEVVVPQIGKVEWADHVSLKGLGDMAVMDLTDFAVEMQHLVIRSTIEWIQQNASDTIVVVPEAWKFIPQGRGTPVQLAAESFIRQGAALRNYLWLDSQDIAGVSKLILKSVPVWVLGVQRESNEVKRTLAQIPAGIKKPKPEAIATLGLGEFFACHGSHITKVYVQPSWMSEYEAVAVAQGTQAKAAFPNRKEREVNEKEAQKLRDENQELRRRLESAEAQLNEIDEGMGLIPPDPVPLSRPRGYDGADVKEEASRIRRGNGVGGSVVFTPDQLEPTAMNDLYQAIKERLIADAPGMLKVLTVRPELEIEVKREKVTADGTGWLGRTAQLLAEGFFNTPKKSGQAYAELKRRGASGISARAHEACESLLSKGFLTREETGYQAVKGMKVNIVEAR